MRALRGTSGANLGGYRYTAFGQTLVDTTTVTQSLRWKGRWHSSIAGGIYHVRAREWAPEVGVFASIDPYEFHHYKTTLWGWPMQNPVGVSDALGHGFDNPSPTELPKVPLSRGILPTTLFVILAVDLDDEPHLRASKVDDVISDDELTPKGEAGLRSGETPPEPLFRTRGREAHSASTLLEELSASRRDEGTTKHEHLREAGAAARRAKSHVPAPHPIPVP